MKRVEITDLLEAGTHFGHQRKRWNPKMKPYIYGTRDGITIFDLTVTMRHLAEACAFLKEVAQKNGQVLFVGAKRQAQETVRLAADRTGMPYMCDRWLGGTLTNNKVIMSRVRYMKELQAMETDGTFDDRTKKEIAGFRREREKLERVLGGIADMKGLPSALVVIDAGREEIAVKEAYKLEIPVVALVDSNCDPDMVDYVIPGNDDALRSIRVMIETLTTALLDGLNMDVESAMSEKPDGAEPATSDEAATPAEKPADDGVSDAASATDTSPADVSGESEEAKTPSGEPEAEVKEEPEAEVKEEPEAEVKEEPEAEVKEEPEAEVKEEPEAEVKEEPEAEVKEEPEESAEASQAETPASKESE